MFGFHPFFWIVVLAWVAALAVLTLWNNHRYKKGDN